MRENLQRTALLLGEENIKKLRRARVIVFGLGGVGGYVVEALARSGIGALELVDDDVVSPSNLNRQILATRDTIGQPKAELAAARVRAIDPEIEVVTHRTFYLPETAEQFDFTKVDYVVDAIDTVTGKLALVERARAAGAPIISAMGAGNKLDPTALRVADISETSVCPLARTMRKELKKRGIESLKVVYSTEKPQPGGPAETGDPADAARGGVSSRRATPGSAVFVPAAMGLAIAAEVVRNLCSD